MKSLSDKGRRQIGLRVLLVICLGNALSFLDRVNVSYAALGMNDEIGLTPELYGFGAGLFFVGYAFFGIPATSVLVRVSAPQWFATIMGAWGILAAAMSLVSTPSSYYVLRFLLGACEAGFAPGAFYYFSRWYPKAMLGRVNAAWVVSTLIAMILAGPLAALLLDWHALDISGWRWMFLIEGVPSIALAAYIFVYLPKDPASAEWLSANDRAVLMSSIDRTGKTHGTELDTLQAAFTSPRVWLYAICFFMYLTAAFGFILWLPQMIQSQFADSSTITVSLMSMIPWLCAAIGTLTLGWNSDRVGDRRWHLVVSAFWVGACLTIGVWMDGIAGLLFLCLGGFGLNAFIALFPAVAMAELKGLGSASGFAIIVGLGAIGGFIGPYIFGLLRVLTGSFHYGMMFFGSMAFAAGLVPLFFPKAFPSIDHSDRLRIPSGHPR